VAGVHEAHEAPLDPELRLQHALDLAYRYLGRRARTEAEVRRQLEDQLVDPDTLEDAVAELVRAALVVPKRRIATKPSRASVRRRLEAKAKRSDVKTGRAKVPGEPPS